MKNKKTIFSILFIAIPLLIAIGFSSWIIIYETIITPQYKEDSISSLFEDNQKVYFVNELEQYPKLKDGTNIDSSSITYQCRPHKNDDSDEGYTNVLPIDAGKYDFKITINDNTANINGTCKLNFEILKMPLTFTEKTEMNYDNSKRTWESLMNSGYFGGKLIFYDKDGQDIQFRENLDYQISNMTNGYFEYNDNLNKTKNIVGSTYKVNFKLLKNINNYSLPRTYFIFYYRTVLVGSEYCTIEEAILNKSGTISLIGDASSTTSFVETSFTKIENVYFGNFSYDLNSRKLLVSMDDENTDSIISYNQSINNVYSALYVLDGITLNVKNNSSVVVAAAIDHVGVVKRRGVLMNYGKINFEGNSILKSYGFTKGTGTIDLSSGSEAIDVFRLYDWPGGSDALSLKNANTFPVRQWSVHNISCKTNIFYGALYNSVSLIYTASMEFPIENIYIIGKHNTANCLFKPLETNDIEKQKNTYISKGAQIVNDSVTQTNQSFTTAHKDYIQLHGEYQDATVNITIKKSIFNYSFSTSTSMAVPISHFDIVVVENSNLLFSQSSYIFDDATSLKIEQNSNVAINGNAYIMSYGSASYIMVNGTLSGSGTIAGTIKTEKEEAILQISKYGVSNIKLKSVTDTISKDATGDIGENQVYTPNSVFTTGKIYFSEKANDGNYYFKNIEKFSVFKIKYYDDDKSTLLNEISIYAVNTDSYTINGNEYLPTKLHYDFDKWTLENGSDCRITITNDINLYANWKYHTYNITYNIYLRNSDDSLTLIEDVSMSELLNEFTLEDFSNDVLSIPTSVSYNGLSFDGWYIGVDSSTNVSFNSITLQQYERYLSETGIDTLVLYGEFSSINYFYITLVSDHPDYADSLQIKVPENGTISNEDMIKINDLIAKLHEYDNKTDYAKYLLNEWKTSDGNDFDLNNIENIKTTTTLTAQWKGKYSLEIQNSDQTHIDTLYYKPGAIINCDDYISKYAISKNKTGHTYNGWFDSSDAKIVNDSFTINNNIIIYPKFTVNTYVVHLSGSGNATVTIKDQNGNTISNGSSVAYGTVLTISIPNYYSLFGSGKKTTCSIVQNENTIATISNQGSANPTASGRGTTTETCTIGEGEITITIL